MTMLGLIPQRWIRSGLSQIVEGDVLLHLGHAPLPAASHPLTSELPRQEAPTESPVTNEWCPVLTDEPVDPEIHTEFSGERVFLCCQKCLKQFRSDPGAYAHNIPALASRAASQNSGDAKPGHVEQQHASSAGELDDSESAATDTRAEQHDHADHADGDALRPAGVIRWLGRFHPMVVHFPIALLLMAAIAEILTIFTGRSRFAFAARFCLWGGALGALVAAPLGWANALAVVEEYTGFSARLLLFHRWFGVATALAAGVALFACERSCRSDSDSRKGPYRAILFSCTLLVIVTGHLGASLIYGWEYLAW